MSAVSSNQRSAVFALIGTILLWGYSWIVMKQVMAHAGPFDFAARGAGHVAMLAYTMPFWAVLLGLIAVSGIRFGNARRR